mmetsp:Transcript_37058/g.74828  ORF Transcript_37058/g.74828 Transcript_37058/m.74828 type:complete len:124 (-) Transcript_37058:143-514(-)
MASVGKTISSVTRPLRAAVKPQKFVAEHRLRSKPMQNDAAREGLIPIAATPAPAVATSGHGHDYPWGVTWPGHSIANEPNINTAEIGKAFMRWKSFSLGGMELWAEMAMTATSVVSSSLPGKK